MAEVIFQGPTPRAVRPNPLGGFDPRLFVLGLQQRQARQQEEQAAGAFARLFAGEGSPVTVGGPGPSVTAAPLAATGTSLRDRFAAMSMEDRRAILRDPKMRLELFEAFAEGAPEPSFKSGAGVIFDERTGAIKHDLRKPEHFKLSPGDIVKDASGAIIAEGPPAERKRELREGLGGALKDIDTGAIVSPGTINVFDNEENREKTIAIDNAAREKAVVARLNSGRYVEVSKAGRQDKGDLLQPGKELIQQAMQTEIAARNFLDASNRAIDLMKGRPEVLAAPGFLARTGSSLAAQAEGLMTLAFGDKSPFVEGQNAATVKSQATDALGAQFFADMAQKLSARLGGTAIDANVLQAAVTDLAFAAAAARAGQTGRALSDKDVEHFMNILGKSGDPAAFIAALEELQERTVGGVQNAFKTINARLPEGRKLEVPKFDVRPRSVSVGGEGGEGSLGSVEQVRTLPIDAIRRQVESLTTDELRALPTPVLEEIKRRLRGQ